jgi:hypothetical protein
LFGSFGGYLGAPREEQPNQFVVHINNILVDDFQGRTNVRRSDQQSFFRFANPAADLQLQMAVGARMLFGIGFLFFQEFKSGAQVVPVLLKDERGVGKVASSFETRFGFELRVGQVVECFDLVGGACFAIEALLQVVDLIDRECARGQKEVQGDGAEQLSSSRNFRYASRAGCTWTSLS